MLKAIKSDLSNVKRFKPSHIEQFLVEANDEYFNGDGSVKLPDDVYDYVKGYLAKIKPDSKVIKGVGAATPEGREKVALPAYMGSLKKLKTDKDIERWVAKHGSRAVVSDKLDGVSGLLVCARGQPPKLYTRGDGSVGEDASFLLEHMQNVPANLQGMDVMVRGEIIVNRYDFAEIVAAGHDFKNPRAMVSGTVNAIKMRRPEVMKRLQFVAYELVADDCVAPRQQLRQLAALGFKVVVHNLVDTFDVTSLSNSLDGRRRDGEFIIDGLVVARDAAYARAKNENPEYAFAFKDMSTHERAESVVTRVDWEVSKDGLLKPTVLFEPVELAGVTIAKATGFNAKYIKDNVVGPGAKVVIVRSGDVIPHIVEVLSPALGDVPMLPSEEAYRWNESGVDIMATQDSPELQMKRLTHFFQKLGGKGISEKTIAALYMNGYDTIKKIKRLAVRDLTRIPGFKEKSASNIVNAIHGALETASLVDFMIASNAFGRGIGEKKLEAVVARFPVLNDPSEWTVVSVEQVQEVDGFAKKTAEQFVTNLKAFALFMRQNALDGEA